MATSPAARRGAHAADHTIIAVDEDGSTQAAPGSREPGLPPQPGPAVTGSVRIDDPADRARAGAARQEAETDELSSALPAGVLTHGQAKGAVLGGLVGLVIGA